MQQLNRATPSRRRSLRAWRPLALLAALAGVLGPGAAAADAGDANPADASGVRVSLPAPGDCATPRGDAEPGTLEVFDVSGSPATRFVGPAVGVGGAGLGIDVPPPAPLRMPARSPCDGVGGPCVAANAPRGTNPTVPVFNEPPPVSSPPPGVPPGLPPGIP